MTRSKVRRQRRAYAIGIVAATFIACGGTTALDTGSDPDATADGEGAAPVSFFDSGRTTADSGLPMTSDSTAPPDVAASPDAPSMSDGPAADTGAGVNADAAGDASAGDAHSDGSSSQNDGAPTDATGLTDVVDAGVHHIPCNDACALGDQECGYPANLVCTPTDDGGESCNWENTPGIETCVQGNDGCTVWGTPSVSACSPTLGCCVIESCTVVQCDAGPFAGQPYCQICPPVGIVGDACTNDTDCQSNACDVNTHECLANGCADGRQDGKESDVDCGGDTCPSCIAGQRCFSSFDCPGAQPCSVTHICE